MSILLPFPSCLWPTPIWSLAQLCGFTHLCCFYPWRRWITQPFQCSPKRSIFTLPQLCLPDHHLKSRPAVWLCTPPLFLPLALFKKEKSLGHHCPFSVFFTLAWASLLIFYFLYPFLLLLHQDKLISTFFYVIIGHCLLSLPFLATALSG